MRVARASVLGCVICIVVLAGTIRVASGMRDWLWEPATQALADLDRAESAWLSRRPDYYRVMFEGDPTTGRCRQIVDVLNEEVISVVENNCSSPLMSVIDFLGALRQRVQGADCRASQCDCLVSYRVVAEYDPQSGRPQRVTLAPMRAEVNLESPAYWERLVTGGPPIRCPIASNSATRTLSMVEVIPLSRMSASVPGRPTR